jgi:hypothetical protein
MAGRQDLDASAPTVHSESKSKSGSNEFELAISSESDVAGCTRVFLEVNSNWQPVPRPVGAPT